MEKQSKQLPSQFPAFRLMVARQMEGHRDRIAARMRKEAASRGESPLDLANALGVYPSTTERWFRGERVPQRRHRKDLAEHWGLEPDWAELDLVTEEQEVRDQLDRMEARLDGVEAVATEILARLRFQQAEQLSKETSERLEQELQRSLEAPPGRSQEGSGN